MVKKDVVWFLVVAFLSFVFAPDFARAETVPSKTEASVVTGIEPSLLEDNGGNYSKETFSVRGSIQLAQANSTQDAIQEESKPKQAAGQESTAKNTKESSGLGKGTAIAIIVGVVLIALVVVAATSRFPSGSINLGIGH